MESWERIQYIMDMEGYNKNSFSETIGITNNATITRIINEKRNASPATCRKIADRFPKYNYKWILSGEGEMLNSEPDVAIARSDKGVPYYEDIESSGGVIVGKANQGNEIPSFYINYEHFNDCSAYIQHVGDSMYPKYCSGEIIAVKRIYNFDIILWGEAYLVVTNGNANDLRTVKLLFQHEDESRIILRSSNPNYRGDTIVNKEDIISLFLVKGKITRNQL